MEPCTWEQLEFIATETVKLMLTTVHDVYQECHARDSQDYAEAVHLQPTSRKTSEEAGSTAASVDDTWQVCDTVSGVACLRVHDRMKWRLAPCSWYWKHRPPSHESLQNFVNATGGRGEGGALCLHCLDGIRMWNLNRP